MMGTDLVDGIALRNAKSLVFFFLSSFSFLFSSFLYSYNTYELITATEPRKADDVSVESTV